MSYKIAFARERDSNAVIDGGEVANLTTWSKIFWWC